MRPPSDVELLNAATKYFYYKSRGSTNGSSNDPDTQLMSDLQTQLNGLNDKITLEEIEEETYDEMYLNAKKNPGSYGLFSLVGLRTTQDWVLAYFFFAYIVISVFIVLTALKESVDKLWTAVAVSGVLLAIGMIFFLMIIYLA